MRSLHALVRWALAVASQVLWSRLTEVADDMSSAGRFLSIEKDLACAYVLGSEQAEDATAFTMMAGVR